jgi:hypothetical protein
LTRTVASASAGMSGERLERLDRHLESQVVQCGKAEAGRV